MIHWFRTSRISDNIQRIRPRAMTAHSTVFFVVIIALYQTESVFGCTVTPSAAAILAGTNISVACRPTSEETVFRWRRQNEDKTLYRVQIAGRDPFVADGYSIASNTSDVILTLINASILHADNYECTCDNSPSPDKRAYTNITVIDSEPQFVAVDGLSLSSDDPVTVTCSMKLAGNASALMQITNFDRKVFAKLNQIISTNVSRLFSLSSTTSSTIENIYLCDISLVNDGSDQKTIFNRRLARSVQFSVRNVSISPKIPDLCQSGEFCEKNSVISCTASGSPEPNYTFTIYQNGAIVGFSANKPEYTTEYVGQQVIQCTAFNVINGIVYSNSINFTTNVTGSSIVPHSNGSNVPLIVGLGGGLGGGLLILIIIIVIIICCKRQKNGVYKGNEDPYTHPQVPQSPSEREIAYTDLILSNNVQVTDAPNDRPTAESYDDVIQRR